MKYWICNVNNIHEHQSRIVFTAIWSNTDATISHIYQIIGNLNGSPHTTLKGNVPMNQWKSCKLSNLHVVVEMRQIAMPRNVCCLSQSFHTSEDGLSTWQHMWKLKSTNKATYNCTTLWAFPFLHLYMYTYGAPKSLESHSYLKDVNIRPFFFWQLYCHAHVSIVPHVRLVD